MPYADLNSPAAKASIKARNARAYQNNRADKIARAVAWNAANPEKARKSSRESRARSHVADPRKLMLINARLRAARKNVPFDLEIDDIVIPERCPMLGIGLFVSGGKATDNSPALDRNKPELGYVKGNVTVLSHRANQIKSISNLEEAKLLVAYLEIVHGTETRRTEQQSGQH